MINNPLFYSKTNIKYPPFKNGLYLEEYFNKFISENNIYTKRKYIPAFWTNFQIEKSFYFHIDNMQQSLNEWVKENPSNDGYFTIVQHADGALLKLPENTIVYGGSKGNFPLPLIYEDKNNTLLNLKKKKFNEKLILCSFVGNITCNNLNPDVRKIIFKRFQNNESFFMINSGGWTNQVNDIQQQIFINATIDSKFALAPRGYGRSSFRFFECFLLGTIPIYIWNDKIWLPFQDVIDYDKLCIVIHINEINELEKILKNIDELKYNNMWKYYDEIKHLFELEGMTKQIINNINQL